MSERLETERERAIVSAQVRGMYLSGALEAIKTLNPLPMLTQLLGAATTTKMTGEELLVKMGIQWSQFTSATSNYLAIIDDALKKAREEGLVTDLISLAAGAAKGESKPEVSKRTPTS